VTLRHAHNGEMQKLRTAYLIGADGADSMVRQILNIALEDKKCDEPWLVVDWELEAGVAFNRDVYQFCDPKRPGTLVPCAGQHIRWEFMINGDDDIAYLEDEANVRALMAPYVPLLSPDLSAQQGTVLRAKKYEFHGLLAHQMHIGRVFLMGDAAHQMPPFLGQGMCSGLRDADNLIWKLVGVLQGKYRATLLDSYHTERHAHVKEVINQAVQIGAIIQTRNRFKAFLRNSFLRLGKLIPKLLSGIEFGKTWRLGPGLLSGDRASGRQILQPQIHQNEHVEKGVKNDKLDALLPDGFCIVLLNPSLETEVRTICATHSALGCGLVVLGAARHETEGWLSAQATALQAVGFILRPDRQIYAALSKKGASVAQQVDRHLADLAAQILTAL
jgi:3-(3-hydroxy-phenyl)propionate hydroxylase